MSACVRHLRAGCPRKPGPSRSARRGAVAHTVAKTRRVRGVVVCRIHSLLEQYQLVPPKRLLLPWTPVRLDHQIHVPDAVRQFFKSLFYHADGNIGVASQNGLPDTAFFTRSKSIVLSILGARRDD